MKELSESLNHLLRKLGDFFDIFDLSFIVSGAVGLYAIIPWLSDVGIQQFPFDGWLQAASVIIGCYVAGLLCFAFGRFLRTNVFQYFRLALGGILSRPAFLSKREMIQHLRLSNDERFENAIRNSAAAHGFGDDYLVQGYLRNRHGGWWLYIRLWAELRQRESLSRTLSFLNRSWVLTATFDGVAAASLLWAAYFWRLGCLSDVGKLDNRHLIGAAVAVIVSLVCSREAQRYVYNQAEEIVATLAAARAEIRSTEGQ